MFSVYIKGSAIGGEVSDQDEHVKGDVWERLADFGEPG